MGRCDTERQQMVSLQQQLQDAQEQVQVYQRQTAEIDNDRARLQVCICALLTCVGQDTFLPFEGLAALLAAQTPNLHKLPCHCLLHWQCPP